jgi:uncharacterized protein
MVENARLEVRLKPRAKGDRIGCGPAGLLDIAVTSPPIDDRANAHLVELLADRLRVPKRAITIIKGGRSRNKVVSVEGLTKEQVYLKLKAAD